MENQKLYEALAKAQAEFKTVVKNRINPAFHSKYADLEAILQACRPALNRHGLFLSQRVVADGNVIKVETILMHESGESISSGEFSMTVPAGKNPVQSAGSTMTYARRYSLSAFLGISADDDDDGNGAAPTEQAVQKFVLTQPMVDEAQAVAKNGVEAYKKYYQSKPAEFRNELASSGWHKACYDIAKNADEAKAQEAA